MGSLEQKKALQNAAAVKIGSAFGSIVVGYAIIIASKGNAPLSMLALAGMLGGVVCWYWGLGQYCVSKGHSGVMAVLGIFGIFGLLAILLLPDKNQVVASAPPVQNAYPREIGKVTTII
jgi:hypothetical protein